MSKAQLYADLPQELLEADDILKRYGRWAMDRHKLHRCGSAEGNYKAPANDDDRAPREIIMATADVERTRAALLALPTVARTVLLWLYVPDGQGLQAKVRRARIPPRLMRERHLEGVEEFWGHWRRFSPMTFGPVARRSLVVA
jgi:hypothetical protein